MEILENNITLAFDRFEKEAAQGFFLFVHGTACALHSGLVKMDISLLDTFLKTQYLYLTKHNNSAEKKERPIPIVVSVDLTIPLINNFS